MRTAIYIRVSTDEQAREGFSISGQKQKLKAFCVSQGWEVNGLYPDEGVSAKDTNRPQLQQMIQDIKDNKIDCVLVYKLDRLTRSVFDLYKLLEVFEAHDCKFKSATEVYDTTTAMGRMFITIVAALAQWERENMGERISFGFAEKARQGKYPHPFAPFGYDLKEDVLFPNSDAKTIQTIYNMYQQMGMNQVAKQLNDNRIYSSNGNEWSDNTIMKTLRNRTYAGDIVWNNEINENTHEPIIDKKLWHATQDLIDQRAGQPPRRVSSRYIFSGVLKCPSCGRSLMGSYSKYKDKLYLYYRCRYNKDGRCSGSENISEIKLEKAFIEYLAEVDYADVYPEVAASAVEGLNRNDDIDLEDLQKQLDKLEKRKKKWQYAWSEDIMSLDDFKRRMDEADQESTRIKEIMDRYKPMEKEHVDRDEIVSMLRETRKNWLTLERSEKKNLVAQTIKQIHYALVGNKVTISHIDFL